MSWKNFSLQFATRSSLFAGAACVSIFGGVNFWSQKAMGQEPRAGLQEPVYRVAERIADKNAPSSTIASRLQAQPGEHPLAPCVAWAKMVLNNIDQNIADYTCTMVKRERVDGVLGEHEFMTVKIRHRPFSVYTGFTHPARVKGQEAIYVEGLNDGNIWGHANGLKHRLLGTVSLKPTSMLAMQGNRYPITEIGFRRLTERLIEVGEQDMQYGECEVQITPGTKVNKRPCTRVTVVHPVPRKNFLFHKAQIFIDDELNLPVRYEAYEWPQEPGGAPVLVEEYTYLDLRINVGLTDADFDIKNPAYNF